MQEYIIIFLIAIAFFAVLGISWLINEKKAKAEEKAPCSHRRHWSENTIVFDSAAFPDDIKFKATCTSCGEIMPTCGFKEHCIERQTIRYTAKTVTFFCCSTCGFMPKQLEHTYSMVQEPPNATP